MATTQLHPGGFPAAALWSFSPKAPGGGGPLRRDLTWLHPAGFPMARMWNFTAKTPGADSGGDRFVGFIANIGRMMLRR